MGGAGGRTRMNAERIVWGHHGNGDVRARVIRRGEVVASQLGGVPLFRGVAQVREDAIHLSEQRGTQLVGPASRDVVRAEHGRRPIVARRADSRRTASRVRFLRWLAESGRGARCPAIGWRLDQLVRRSILLSSASVSSYVPGRGNCMVLLLDVRSPEIFGNRWYCL